MTNAMSYIITLADGRLAATSFPEDKRLFSEVLAILSADYVRRGGTITRK